LKDLLPDLERRSPAEVGVGVVGIIAPAPPFTLSLLCSAVGVVLAGRGGRRGRHWRHERRRGGAGVGRAVVVAFQRPGHVDAEIEP